MEAVVVAATTATTEEVSGMEGAGEVVITLIGGGLVLTGAGAAVTGVVAGVPVTGAAGAAVTGAVVGMEAGTVVGMEAGTAVTGTSQIARLPKGLM